MTRCGKVYPLATGSGSKGSDPQKAIIELRRERQVRVSYRQGARVDSRPTARLNERKKVREGKDWEAVVDRAVQKDTRGRHSRHEEQRISQ